MSFHVMAAGDKFDLNKKYYMTTDNVLTTLNQNAAKKRVAHSPFEVSIKNKEGAKEIKTLLL